MTISLNSTQLENLQRAVRAGLKAFERPEPMTLVEWSDENFYLSSESSYIEGRWKTLPFQIAMMNAIGHDDIVYVNIIKSARVGYSQMLRAALGYFTEHKARNLLIFQATDGAAQNFMKTSVETMIRDVPVVKGLAPWYGKKHRDNTLFSKRFTNGKMLFCVGGEAAKNYREKSVDGVMYDELAAFKPDVEKEGSPTFLGDKRIEGSVFPKSVRGSTPKVLDTCQITKAASEAEFSFKAYLPCPHCQEEQVLKWGGKEAHFGFKWQENDPKTVMYLCEHCGTLCSQGDIQAQHEKIVWRCDVSGVWTKDGAEYFDGDGSRREAPESVAFHIWTAYSPFTTWRRIVTDFLKAKGDPIKLKTFINTTLGEAWDDTEGEKIEPDNLFARREHYQAQVAVDSCVLTAAVDTQDDRLELDVVAWVNGEESYRVAYKRLYGDLSRTEIWNLLHKELTKQYTSPSGALHNIKLTMLDSGGHFTDEVYKFSKKYGPRQFIPIKGHSIAGKPVVAFPRKRNDKGVYLTMIGTDTAKEIITSRFRIMNPGEGYMHWPVSDEFDETYFQQITNERRKVVYRKGRKQIEWDAGSRRQEPFDTAVYNLAAIRLLQQHFGVNLARYRKEGDESGDAPPKKKRKTGKVHTPTGGWL